ncbi:MAG: helix-turn-helix domain-containing protein, partial [Acidimicrobiales bacterium]
GRRADPQAGRPSRHRPRHHHLPAAGPGPDHRPRRQPRRGPPPRRNELRLTQATLADAAGVDKRQLARYEKGEAQPTLGVAIALAEALGLSLTRLAGRHDHEVDLGGHWWAAWQTTHHGETLIHHHELLCDQDRRTLAIKATTRATHVENGGYLWRGELQLWDNEILMGWYVAMEGAVRSKGTMYFQLHPQGLSMTGRWVGLSFDDPISTGWAAITRDETETKRLIHELIDQGDPDHAHR